MCIDMAEHSFVRIESDELIRMCESTIAKVNVFRDQEREKLIEQRTKRMEASVIRRIFHEPPPTREEAIASLKADGFLNNYDFTQVLCQRQMDIAQTLLAAAKMSDHVMVSCWDLNYVR